MATLHNRSPTPVFKRFGGKGRAIDGRNIFSVFLFFSPNMSGISVCEDIRFTHTF